MFKKCFTCNWQLPLFLFQKDGMRYQRESDKGRVKVCRVCNYKKWSKLGEAWMFNHTTRKFEKVTFESRWAIIKRVLR